MKMTWFERETPPELGKGASAHELLKIIYQCQNLPLHVRMRAAMACLPFETPKLGITYQATESDFASLLDARIKRHQMRLIEHQPQPAVEVKIPKAHTVDRRFRRL
jgi:hypothetical protein